MAGRFGAFAAKSSHGLELTVETLFLVGNGE